MSVFEDTNHKLERVKTYLNRKRKHTSAVIVAITHDSYARVSDTFREGIERRIDRRSVSAAQNFPLINAMHTGGNYMRHKS